MPLLNTRSIRSGWNNSAACTREADTRKLVSVSGVLVPGSVPFAKKPAEPLARNSPLWFPGRRVKPKPASNSTRLSVNRQLCKLPARVSNERNLVPVSKLKATARSGPFVGVRSPAPEKASVWFGPLLARIEAVRRTPSRGSGPEVWASIRKLRSLSIVAFLISKEAFCRSGNSTRPLKVPWRWDVCRLKVMLPAARRTRRSPGRRRSYGLSWGMKFFSVPAIPALASIEVLETPRKVAASALASLFAFVAAAWSASSVYRHRIQAFVIARAEPTIFTVRFVEIRSRIWGMPCTL